MPSIIKEPNDDVLSLSLAYVKGLETYININMEKIKNSIGIELIIAQLQDGIMEALKY